MHYKDGTPAQLGDVVKGKGYNIKGADGQPAEIVGQVAHLSAGATTCNLKIVRIKSIKLGDDFRGPNFELFSPKCVIESGVAYVVESEYGQVDHFELVHRPAA
jgi:hypothetical protein